ncbi:MAG: hypothetical protein DLM70_17205 [Chloroflexi bacterium]|nr:MAG: hypothetical protein DLM70_17205 [Chloroflexota bacterium]
MRCALLGSSSFHQSTEANHQLTGCRESHRAPGSLHIAIGIVAGRSKVPTSVTTGELPLFLGLTLAAQNVLIWLRGQETTMGTMGPAR